MARERFLRISLQSVPSLSFREKAAVRLKVSFSLTANVPCWARGCPVLRAVEFNACLGVVYSAEKNFSKEDYSQQNIALRSFKAFSVFPKESQKKPVCEHGILYFLDTLRGLYGFCKHGVSPPWSPPQHSDG
jgi:hypothetical protein